MSDYPLVFTLRDAIVGNGFVAGVAVSGRAVMTLEDGQWWVYGVRPAALAAYGSTEPEAYGNFRNRYREVLFDIASEAATFAAFEAAVTRFFNETDPAEDTRWAAAVEAIRAGRTEPGGAFGSLPKEQAEARPPSVSVQRLVEHRDESPVLSPEQNLADRFAAAA